MIPNKVLSTQTFKDDYLVPDNLPTQKLLDYEEGGIGIQNPAEGLRYQTWKLEFIGANFLLSANNTSPYILFTSEDIRVYKGQTDTPEVTEISLAFDQNMNPFVAFVADDQASYWWFNSVTGKQEFADIPDDDDGFKALTPRCCIDDKRKLETSTSDIILAYAQHNKLFFRAERDRYTVAYQLMDNAYLTVDKVGMNRRGRLQFRVVSTQDV